jgi:hypothetical protein
MGWILGLIIILMILFVVPEILIMPLMLLEFILRLFGKSFDDKPKK